MADDNNLAKKAQAPARCPLGTQSSSRQPARSEGQEAEKELADLAESIHNAAITQCGRRLKPTSSPSWGFPSPASVAPASPSPRPQPAAPPAAP